jgi:hypothetical protein
VHSGNLEPNELIPLIQGFLDRLKYSKQLRTVEPADAKVQAELRTLPEQVEAGYLRLTLDIAHLRVTSESAGSVEFGAKKPWQLFHTVFSAGELGVSRSALMDSIWGEPVAGSNLDQQKRKVNETIQPIGVEIEADSRSIWRLVLLPR